MKNVLLRIREIQNNMTDTKLNICEYIEKYPYEVTKMSIRELAEKSYSSPSSIIRLIREIGFESYGEFKQELLVDLNTLETSNIVSTKVDKEDTTEQIINKITYSNMQSLQDSAALLDIATIDLCVDYLTRCNNLLLFGMGSSYLCAQDAFLKFIRIHKNCFAAEDWHTQLLFAKNASKQDVALVFSYSGETKEMLKVTETLKENKTPVFAITRYSKNPLSKLADYNLYVAGNESTFRKGAMSSRVSQLNIIDIIYSIFINKQYDVSMQQLVKTHIDKDK